ncbi:metallophosphoesterase [Mesorhizobium sp. ZMM04-5]|uniref:Metallophosphoesterase n=1 Tax=Mesorhizobium marinum TaxID=3228790 RepID=A0ABV3R2Z1_9HYPH
MAAVHYRDAKGPQDTVVYAIGDVHGRLDLLTDMHCRIDDEIARRGGDWRIVHLGDYVDRGPESAGVVEFLRRRAAADGRVVALAGNHDLAFLEFFSDPDPGGLFALYGGVQTAQSYGVALDLFDPFAFRAAHRALDAAVPRSHRDYLGGLPLSVAYGDFFFCHAGIRPGVPLERQERRDLIWIRGEFHRHPGLYEKVVVHGHTPVPEPEVRDNRVNLDTGAFASGRLSALVIDGAQKRLLVVEEAA